MSVAQSLSGSYSYLYQNQSRSTALYDVVWVSPFITHLCKHYLRENLCSCWCHAPQIVDHNLNPSGFSSLRVIVEGDTKRTGIGLYINVCILLFESYWTQGARFHETCLECEGKSALTHIRMHFPLQTAGSKISAGARQSMFLHAFIHETKKPVTTANLYLVDRIDAFYLIVIKMNYLSYSIDCHDCKAEMLPGASRDNQIGVMYGSSISEDHLYQVRIPARVSITSSKVSERWVLRRTKS